MYRSVCQVFQAAMCAGYVIAGSLYEALVTRRRAKRWRFSCKGRKEEDHARYGQAACRTNAYQTRVTANESWRGIPTPPSLSILTTACRTKKTTPPGGDASARRPGSVADASGLLYMNARYYNPSTARFLSQDTYTGSAFDPWTQHLYAYCNNNPINMIDPTGHNPLLISLLVAITAVILTGCNNQASDVESTGEPESTPVRMQVVPTPSPAPAQIPPSSWGNTDIPAIIAKRNNASDSAIKMNDKAAEHLGAPYQCPPKDEGTYDCASLVRAAARTIDTKFRGGSCKKQRNYIAGLYSENPNPPWFFTSGTELQRDMLFMIPGDLIYWESSTNPSHGHVAIYLGEGYILDATESGGGVAYRQYTDYVNANPRAAYVGYARYSGN